MNPKFLIVQVSLLLLVLFSCASIDKATKDYSPMEEYYLGRSVMANALGKMPLLKNDFALYLNRIGNYLALFSARPYTYKGFHIGILASDDVLAFSAPGGHILLSKGLILQLNNEDELAAIIAHELVHIEKNHALQAIRRSGVSEIGINTGLALISFFTQNQDLRNAMDNYNELVGEYAELVINGSYNKEQEIESDQGAVAILTKAGYDPNALAHALGLIKKHGSEGGWLSHHPADDHRISLLPQNAVAQNPSRHRRFINQKRLLSHD